MPVPPCYSKKSMEFDPRQHPHRRTNLLTGEHVLVSPHRTSRPWQGRLETIDAATRPSYDSQCYLCPGNTRANGEANPDYSTTFAFQNDFSALLPQRTERPIGESIFDCEPASGECRVLCFSPRHDLSLAEMEPGLIRHVVDLWADQSDDLGRRYPWVQVFENKGDLMGCSNPHPHGQVWASSFVPSIVHAEDEKQRSWADGNGSSLLLDVVEAELQAGERIVDSNDEWVLFVPFWATWPFEYLLVPRRNVQRLPDLTVIERNSLSKILSSALVRYDNLFETSFPYSMGWHGAPFDGSDQGHWQLHAHFYPPLLRSATVKKFMVGYEMLAEAQRDITPEQAAERLRSLPRIHYKAK